MNRPFPSPGQPAAWYPNPSGGLSYWDGYQWTGHHLPPPASATSRVSNPVVGWVLLGAGVMLALGAFLPWVTAFGGALSKNGLDGGSDGIITLVLGLGVAAIGFTIGMRHGLLWAPITAAVLSALAGLTAVVDMNDVSGRAGVEVGSGLWVTAVAAFAALILAIVAMAVRE